MKRFQNMIILLPGLLVLLTSVVFASDKNEPPQENVKLSGKIYSYPFGIDGNPYLQEEWQDGNLNLENGKTAHHVKIRLNLIDNDLIFYNETLKKVFIADKETVRSFTMNPGSTDSLFFIKYTGDGYGYKLKTNDFVRVLCQGKIIFFVKHMVEILKANELTSKDKVHPKIYYFVNTEKGISEIKLNVKSITRLFPKQKQEILKMVRTNKIKNHSEESLTKLIQLLNNQ